MVVVVGGGGGVVVVGVVGFVVVGVVGGVVVDGRAGFVPELDVSTALAAVVVVVFGTEVVELGELFLVLPAEAVAGRVLCDAAGAAYWMIGVVPAWPGGGSATSMPSKAPPSTMPITRLTAAPATMTPPSMTRLPVARRSLSHSTTRSARV